MELSSTDKSQRLPRIPKSCSDASSFGQVNASGNAKMKIGKTQA